MHMNLSRKKSPTGPNMFMGTRVNNPGKSIGGHRSSTTVPSVATSVATSVAVTVFAVATGVPPVGNGGHRWAIGGDRWLRWAIGGPSMKSPQKLVTLRVRKKTRFCKNYVFNVLNKKIACQKHVENSKSQFEFINTNICNISKM